MAYLFAILMGIVQGLTEFLPVSSSGHLALAENIFGKSFGQDLSFEAFLHLGSLLAVLIFFRRDIVLLAQGFLQPRQIRALQNRKITYYILASTVVTGLLGFLGKDFLENAFSSPLLVGICFGITGFILFFSDKFQKTSLDTEDLGYERAMLIGLGQAIAILPGISRSGTTVAVSLFAGLKRTEAARYSFLISIPAILGANLSEFKALLTLSPSLCGQYLLGATAAFLAGWAVIKILLEMISKARLKYFSYYLWSISFITIIYFTVIK